MAILTGKNQPHETPRGSSAFWVRDGDPLDADLADLSALDAESARHAAGAELFDSRGLFGVVTFEITSQLEYLWKYRCFVRNFMASVGN